MAHAHDHGHSHSHSAKISNRNKNAFLVGIALNMAFVIAEVVAGILNNSMALLTDAGHNLSDVASLLISLVAFWMAKKKSTAVYTYGFKKTTVLAALANAVVLLVAIGILGYESVTRLLHPEVVSGGVIAWVAAIGIAVNGISAFLFFRQKQELNSRAAYLHLLADALVSLGVVIAGIIISYTHIYWLDPAIGILIMVVILISTWGLLRDSFKMTIDAVPSGIELEKIKDVIRKVPHVKSVHHVHVWPLSTTENALTAVVILEDRLPFDQKVKVVAEIKHELLHCEIHHSTIELGVQGDAV
jgi:cobalt-zinc-cadmium efflux system protein